MTEQEVAQTRYKRSLSVKLKAFANPSNLIAIAKIFLQCDRPIEFLRRYITMSGGTYPTVYGIRTPIGKIGATAFNPDDVLTINEIFFRGDYGTAARKTVADFGSNIGISALFFLSRSPDAFVYCYEPLPQNIEKLKQNLAGFENRFELNEVAVSETDGFVEFGWEPTGRYGGIGSDVGEMMRVPAVDSNKELARIVERHGRIDLLKIDIERLEQFVTDRIPEDTARNIDQIVVELEFSKNAHATTHHMHYRRPITTFTRNSATPAAA